MAARSRSGGRNAGKRDHQVGAVFNTMVKFFLDDDWPLARADDQSMIVSRYEGENADWVVVAQALEDEAISFVCCSLCPIAAPLGRFSDVAELLHRINLDLPAVGCFELDYDDGSLFVRTGLALEGAEVAPELIRNAVHVNVGLMDQYLPAIRAVAEEDEDALDALDALEECEE